MHEFYLFKDNLGGGRSRYWYELSESEPDDNSEWEMVAHEDVSACREILAEHYEYNWCPSVDDVDVMLAEVQLAINEMDDKEVLDAVAKLRKSGTFR